MVYIITILIAAALIIAGHMIFLPFSMGALLDITLSVTVGAVGVFAIDGIFAFIIRRLTPKSWYMPSRRIFEVPKREFKFYQKLGVKKWARIIPELGAFTGFHKDSVGNINDTKYLERFIYEANYGVVIHLENALFGFLIMFLPFVSGRPSVWIPIYIVNFVLSMMPVFILRFNNYTLTRLYRRSLRQK